MSDPVEYSPSVMQAIVRAAEAAVPSEGCGLVFGRGGRAERAVVIENVYDRYRARDSARYPRTSATAYLMDPRAQLAAMEAAEADGLALVAVFHSHVEVGAYFSAEDRAMALADGEPLWPGVEYVVVSVRAGRADGARAYAWTGADFAERELPLS